MSAWEWEEDFNKWWRETRPDEDGFHAAKDGYRAATVRARKIADAARLGEGYSAMRRGTAIAIRDAIGGVE